MKTVKEILIEARGLIEKGWCQGAIAKNSDGVPVLMESDEACEFCILGSLCKVGGVASHGAARTELQRAINNKLGVTGINISSFNDRQGTTKEAVLDVFDKAIEACDAFD